MVAETDPVAALRDKYDVMENPRRWLVACRNCPKTWNLEKGFDVRPALITHLLNHAEDCK